MGIYTKSIREKEKNNLKSEQYADEALLKDTHFKHVESETDDIQNAIFYILDKFKIKGVSRIQDGTGDASDVIEALLAPLGMMYDFSKSALEAGKTRTEYILAFRKDGKAVVIRPTIFGYRWHCTYDSTSGLATKKYLNELNSGCYVINRPIEKKTSILGTFVYNVFKYLTIYDLIRLFFAIGIIYLSGLVIPLINKWVYKEYIPNPSQKGFWLRFVILGFLTVTAMRAFLTMTKSLTLFKVKNRVSQCFQSAIMAKVLHLPQSFFRSNSSGKLSRRINSCGRLSEMVLDVILNIILDFSFISVYFIQMHQIAPQLYGIALLFPVIRLLFSLLVAILNAKKEEMKLNNEMESSQLMYSSVKGIQKIKATGTERVLYSKWAELYSKSLAYEYKLPFLLKYQSEILSAILTCATITLMVMASYTNITREDYMVFLASYALVNSGIQTFIDMMQDLFTMKVLARNVTPIFDADQEQKKKKEYIKNISGKIRAENIHFKYKNSPNTCLNGVSLNIKAGEKVAIVGESGCGKSTFLQILLGMEVPTKGMVYYDDKAINSLNLKSLRRLIGSVFQFSKIFPGTIESNVTFTATKNVGDKEVWDALDKAEIKKTIEEQPLGLGTEITQSSSSGFSGGQRQRLLLARAFLNNPKVMLLDEATSALDNVTQNKVLKSILKSRATVVMVAHRLSTVVEFDRIIMLEKGVIVEEGTYKELIQKEGKFFELVRKQLVKKK